MFVVRQVAKVSLRFICRDCKCVSTLVTAGEDGKFEYKKGSVYSYHYIVNSTALVLGGPPTQSALHLSAKVSLRFVTACDVILFVSLFPKSYHQLEPKYPAGHLSAVTCLVPYIKLMDLCLCSPYYYPYNT